MPIAARLFSMKYAARSCRTFKPLIAFSFCSEECSPAGSRWCPSARRSKESAARRHPRQRRRAARRAKLPLEVRKQRVDAEASRLAALGATLVGVLFTEGLDHYAVAMRDPKATSSTSTDPGAGPAREPMSAGCQGAQRDLGELSGARPSMVA